MLKYRALLSCVSQTSTKLSLIHDPLAKMFAPIQKFPTLPALARMVTISVNFH